MNNVRKNIYYLFNEILFYKYIRVYSMNGIIIRIRNNKLKIDKINKKKNR